MMDIDPASAVRMRNSLASDPVGGGNQSSSDGNL
jgi:hypothetical protein